MNNEEIKKALHSLYDCKTDFEVIQSGKKSNRVNGLYKPDTHEIILHNKNFKTDNEMLYTAIHELTHHILTTENNIKTTRSHSGAFWATFYNFVDKAVELGLYSRKRNEDVQTLIDSAKQIQTQINAAQKSLGELLNKLSSVCAENGDRFEDVIEHDLQITRNKAKRLQKLPSHKDEVTEEMAAVIDSAKDLMIKQAAVKAAESGKTVEQVKALTKKTKDYTDNGLDSPERLIKEKRRLESTIEQLSDRLVQVEETLRSITGVDL